MEHALFYHVPYTSKRNHKNANEVFKFSFRIKRTQRNTFTFPRVCAGTYNYFNNWTTIRLDEIDEKRRDRDHSLSLLLAEVMSLKRNPFEMKFPSRGGEKIKAPLSEKHIENNGVHSPSE